VKYPAAVSGALTQAIFVNLVGDSLLTGGNKWILFRIEGGCYGKYNRK